MTEHCEGCQKPIKRGDARWVGQEPEKYWHFECHENVRRDHQPSADAIVIQMTTGFGGAWVDLSTEPDVRIAMAVRAGLKGRRETRGRELRIIKVIAT